MPIPLERSRAHALARSKALVVALAWVAFFSTLAACRGSGSAATPPRAISVYEADEFERADLGPSWSESLGSVGIVNRSDLGLAARSPIGLVTWVGSNLGSDQFSAAIISSEKPANMLVQVFTRRRGVDLARYGFHYNSDSNQGTPAGAWEIKYDGVPSVETRILATVGGGAPFPGDEIRLEARGTNPVELKGFVNGALVLSALDSAPNAIEGGRPGVAYRLQSGTVTTYPSPVVESWRGGSLTPSAQGTSF